jgi:hypothetical protein
LKNDYTFSKTKKILKFLGEFEGKKAKHFCQNIPPTPFFNPWVTPVRKFATNKTP